MKALGIERLLGLCGWKQWLCSCRTDDLFILHAPNLCKYTPAPNPDGKGSLPCPVLSQCIEKSDARSTLLKATTSYSLWTSDSQPPVSSGVHKLNLALIHFLSFDKFLRRETCRMLLSSVCLVQIPRFIGGGTEVQA